MKYCKKIDQREEMGSNNKDSKGGIPAITGNIDYSKAIHIFPESLLPWRSTVLAYGASFISTTFGYPFDTVKTRMQTHKNFTSNYDCVKKTFMKEGVRGFFRGIWAPLISTSFSKSISVSIFSMSKPICYNLFYSNGRYEHIDPFIKNVPVCFLSGMASGACVSLFASPFEFTKIYSQIRNLVDSKSTADVTSKAVKNGPNSQSLSTNVRNIVKYEGILGLYSGYKYHLLRDSCSTGIYFSSYEMLKWSMNKLINKDPNKPSQISILLSGGFAGILCWTLIFPIDTTKSLIQKDAVTNILRKAEGLEPYPPRSRKFEGINRRLYRGLGVSIARTFVVNMVFFSVFEFAMAHVT